MTFEILAAVDLWSTIKEGIPVVLALIVIEGLLSVDNALAIAAMASHLDEKQRKTAMNIGYAGAYGFRIVALLTASLIMGNHWLMLVGSLYLIWLMCSHFADQDDGGSGNGVGKRVPRSFANTIAMIAFLDLSLSFDNVVAAVAFARDSKVLVYIGVTLGIITLRLVAGYCIKLLERQPWLEHTAFLLVGFVGLLLGLELHWDYSVKHVFEPGGFSIISESGGHYHIAKSVKFAGIISIILLHLAYEKNAVVKGMLQPILRLFLPLVRLIAGIAGFFFGLLSWPFRAMMKAVSRKLKSPSDKAGGLQD
jgi:YkoY family integral membrane protein